MVHALSSAQTICILNNHKRCIAQLTVQFIAQAKTHLNTCYNISFGAILSFWVSLHLCNCFALMDEAVMAA